MCRAEIWSWWTLRHCIYNLIVSMIYALAWQNQRDYLFPCHFAMIQNISTIHLGHTVKKKSVRSLSVVKSTLKQKQTWGYLNIQLTANKSIDKEANKEMENKNTQKGIIYVCKFVLRVSLFICLACRLAPACRFFYHYYSLRVRFM